MNTNFVIIAAQRTGSNMLVSALDNHPKIRCHGELFRRKNLNMKGALKVLRTIPSEFQSEDYRDIHFREYLEAVKGTDGKKPFFGFKLMLNQSETARAGLIENSNVKKVLLFRENLLAVFSSSLIAKATGQGAVVQGKEVIQAKVQFEPKRFEKFRKNHDKRFKEARQKLAGRPGIEWIETEYLKICKLEGIAEVMQFIGVDPETASITVKTAKRNPSNILDRFTNPEAVLAHLKLIGKGNWVDEVI